MTLQNINSNVTFVGVKHWDRRLFDELIPLPHGTSYNSYLVQGSEKIALIDTVDPEVFEHLLLNLNQSGINSIDYIIANHAEQDHSGSIPFVLEKYPEVKIVTNEKCKGMLLELMPIKEEAFIVIKDEEILSLGDKHLKFLLTPWVHWPETMSTYLMEDEILFSCDFFGAHIAASELFVKNEAIVLESAKRYYAEIMMPFRAKIKNNLEKLKDYKISYIAPSHGLVYNRPELIINAYQEWISPAVKNEVVIPYVSMHGSTKKMVEHLIEELSVYDIIVKPFNLTVSDLGELAMSLVDAATVILASPMVLAGAHPEVLYGAALINALRPKTKFVGIMSSYGWGGMIEKQLRAMLSKMKVEFFPILMVKGEPKQDDYAAIIKLAKSIKLKHDELKIGG